MWGVQRLRVCAFVGVLVVSGIGTAFADGTQLGFDFGGGPMVPIHGEQATPGAWARAGLVLHVPGWGAEAGVVAIAEGLGATAAIRRYVPLASGERNLIRWRIAAFGAAGWTHARRQSSVSGREAATATLAATMARPSSTPIVARVAGPRLGAGIELALTKRDTLVWSRIGIQGTYQQLRTIDQEDRAGYAFAELAFTTSVGR